MAAVDQISVKVSEDYIYSEDVDLIYTDSEDDVIQITLGTPDGQDSVIIQDLGNASNKNISIVSTQLINGQNGFTIDTDGAAYKFTYKPVEGFYIVESISDKGFIFAGADITLTAAERTVFVNGAAGINDSPPVADPFTVYLNPTPETGDEVELLDSGPSCGSYPVTVDGNGNQIAGDLQLEDDVLMNIDLMVLTLKFNGTFWNIK
jgi:hypothetical protein